MVRVVAASMSLIAACVGSAAWPMVGDDPLLRPIAPEPSARWLTPQAPVRVFGNTYLVGFGGLTVALIRTDAGLILIDGALPQAVPAVEANIRALGFNLRDIKFILSTEPHFDHAGGLAALARDTGAHVVASPAAARVLQGKPDPADPQAEWLEPFPAVRNVWTMVNGERLKLGSTTVTARATPGHTAGSMSWTWQACEGRRCLDIVFASSLNPVAPDSYKFSDPAHGSTVTSFRRTFSALRKLPCDILLTAHPDQSGGGDRYDRLQRQRAPNPYVDPGGCKDYADRHEQLLNARLARERAKSGD